MATPPGMATFSYSEPLLLSEYNVMFARPGLMPSGDGFIWPFTQLLWVLLLVSCVIVFVATMFTLRGQAVMLRAAVDRGGGFGDSSDVEEMEMDGGTWWRSANRAFLWTWSVLMSQSVPWTPLGTAVRLVAGMWLLWIVVMGALYRSNLKAMLILPKVRLPFDSLEELAASGIPLGVPEDSMVEALLKESDSSSVLGRLRQNMRILGVENYEKHSADLFGGMLAVASYTSTLRRAIHSDFSFKGRCRTYLMSRGFFGPASLSMVFPRGSPLMAKVNKIIEQLREAGILDYLLNAAYFNGTECLKPITSFSLPSERPLELLDFYGMFALYLAGIVLALLVFLLEMTFDPTKRGKKMGGDGRAP
ncbi:glutamate receptor 4-like [Eriocheir sinensis]|uniref:glutamate receptor 4-like n=1 Tax=Eriocheir sinensis TaxID=95602 RepID=UPI0021C7D680|nr:glutamate receptor 4-like [Eriocheir sinensis]